MTREMWHISMNEGLTEEDVADNHVVMENWVRRGFDEELNVGKRVCNINFYSLFINTHTFEIGIFSVADVMSTIDDFFKNLNSAKDFNLENKDIKLLSDNYKEIERFVSRRKDVTDACRYCLLTYLSRFNSIDM